MDRNGSHSPNGLPLIGQRARAGVNFHALVRHLDPDGTYEPAQVISAPAGPVGIPSRDQYMDASELLEAIRAIVREEIVAALAARD